MIQRLRSRRDLVTALAPLAVLWLLLLGAHTHGVGRAEPGAAGRGTVPTSVVSNPDAPSTCTHLHAGRLASTSPCAACLLSHQPGSTVVVASLVIEALSTSWPNPRFPSHDQATRCSSAARAPPHTS